MSVTKERVTARIQSIVRDSGITEGICYLYVPHTNNIPINESADSDVITDIVSELNKIIPFQDNYRHSEGHSAAHIKASVIGPSEMIPIENGRLTRERGRGFSSVNSMAPDVGR